MKLEFVLDEQNVGDNLKPLLIIFDKLEYNSKYNKIDAWFFPTKEMTYRSIVVDKNKSKQVELHWLATFFYSRK